ncbi:MAG TPA: glycosyltransferase family 2 protein [Bryobacterales bacterium]|nr:glycosyltransferase family 2 protein [Bryobacterales bacterium]
MKLQIAIPAYNEESSIESIINLALAARGNIIASSPITDVQITVVSDGSTDHTVELAKRFGNDVDLVVFESNRGYGAAIKEAWNRSDADLLGFLDADGTCDPNFFSQLCNTIETEHADVALGCRMNRQSRMPAVRRLGNLIFAWLLQVFSSRAVRDTASGMRVVRRDSLRKLLPLPDGMHFTPAMSARALLGKGIKIAEIDMPYREREGESKLRVGKDGLRFLQVIVEAAFLYKPWRPLGILSLLSLAAAAGLMVMPAAYYLAHRSVLEWMIYRFVVADLAGASACLLFCSSYLSRKIVDMTLSNEVEPDPKPAFIAKFFSSSWFWLAPLLLFLAGGLLVLPSFLELVRTGATYEHWSRFIAMSFLFSVAIILLVTRVMDYVLGLIEGRLSYFRSQSADP